MKKITGFSLIELLVVIAIIALLAAYAIPNYRQYVVKSKRVEAQNKVLEVAGMFEKFYANTNAYPGALGDLSLDASYTSWKDYDLSVNFPNGGGWTIRAIAKGNQAQDDSGCGQIRFNNLGVKSPADCWD